MSEWEWLARVLSAQSYECVSAGQSGVLAESVSRQLRKLSRFQFPQAIFFETSVYRVKFIVQNISDGRWTQLDDIQLKFDAKMTEFVNISTDF